MLTIFAVSTLFAQQESLYDNGGQARAYIDYDQDATIFMWDGTPVAYIEKVGGDMCVFGFNRRFLGWYEDGIIYDKNGYVAGACKDAINMLTMFERVKGVQKVVPVRPITSFAPFKPFWKNYWSSTSLTELLNSGKR